MPPGRKPRWVYWRPGIKVFKPVGPPSMIGGEVIITIDEMEAMRLVDYEGLKQEEAANTMKISQPTLNRLLMTARAKIMDAIINGKVIRIEGGDYNYVEDPNFSPGYGFGRGYRRGYGRGRKRYLL